MVAVSATLSARSTQTRLAPSRANSREAARPMPLPAPVMTAVRPWRRPMDKSLCGGFGAARRGGDGVHEDVVEAGRQVVAHAGDDPELRAGDGCGRGLAADLHQQRI